MKLPNRPDYYRRAIFFLAFTTILSQRQNAADFVDRISRLKLREFLSRRGRLMENILRVMEVPVVRATQENIVEYGLFIGADIPNSGLTIPFYKGSVEEGHNFPS